MPDLHLYMTDIDDIQIATSILNRGCTMIPDLHYDSPTYANLTTVAEYRDYRGQTPAFYLVADSFFKSPLELREIQKNGKSFYYIYPRSGGPTMRFLAGGTFKENGSLIIRSGELGYYLTYANTLNSHSETAPRELVAVYKSLAKDIRQNSVSVRLGRRNRVFWLGKDAVRAVRACAKLVGFEKYDVAKLI